MFEKIDEVKGKAGDIWNNVIGGWYIREPVYDSSVRAPKTYEGYVLGALALSFFFVPLTVGLIDKVS